MRVGCQAIPFYIRSLLRADQPVFRMFTKVIAGILLHAPRPRDKATQTE